MTRGHPPPHCETTQVLREAITNDDDDEFLFLTVPLVGLQCLIVAFPSVCNAAANMLLFPSGACDKVHFMMFDCISRFSNPINYQKRLYFVCLYNRTVLH